MVVRFNPCGRLVDFVKRPFTTKAQFFRNSDAVANLVFYPCREDAPALGFPSVFLGFPGDYPPWPDDPVGPEITASITNNYQKVKLGAMGQHFCGTPEDFLLGGIYDPTLPPVVYLPNGLPICCNGGVVGFGGGVGGGSATWVSTPLAVGYGGGVGGGSADVIHSPVFLASGGGVGGGRSPFIWSASVAVAGGGVGGGSSPVVWSASVAVAGGGVGGGAAVVMWSPVFIASGGGVGGGSSPVVWSVAITGDGSGVGGGSGDVNYTAPTPGATCLTAAELADGYPYDATQTAGVDQWYTFAVAVGGGSFIVSLSAGSDPARFTLVQSGTCAGLTVIGAGFGDANIVMTTAGAPFQAFVQVSSAVGGTYTIQWDQL